MWGFRHAGLGGPTIRTNSLMAGHRSFVPSVCKIRRVVTPTGYANHLARRCQNRHLLTHLHDAVRLGPVSDFRQFFDSWTVKSKNP